MRNLLKFVFLNILTVTLAFAGMKKGVSVAVDLSPAGSFEIKGKLKGKAIAKGGGFYAKKLSFRVKRLKTGLDLRDKHTKEKLEYKKYPQVIVTDAIGKGGKGEATINVRGIKKKIKFTFIKAGKYIKAVFPLNLKDFKFSGINYMGVGVKDRVNVTAVVPVK